MDNRRLGQLKTVFCICYILCAAVLSAQPDVHTAAQKLAQKAFVQKSEAAVRQVFEQGLAGLPDAQAQVQALSLLASYEAYHGSYSQAAAHYLQAAALNTETKTDLLLEAVRVFLCGGNFDAARSLLSEIAAGLPVNTENAQYRTAAVYDAWRLLAEDRADRAVPLITAYAGNKAFADYHPALLFTLWWVNGDEKAKERLLKEYPSGIEAAAVHGTVMVQPSVFWYLMPKTEAFAPSAGTVGTTAARQPGNTTASVQQHTVNAASIESRYAGTAASAQNASGVQEPQTKPLYYQLGFYKIKAYAERLAEELRQKQFRPLIKEETRPSGAVYFAVLVEENSAGDIGLRLKGAGYEAFPVFP